MTPDNGNLVVRPGKLLMFTGSCAVLVSLSPDKAGRYYSSDTRLLVLVLTTGFSRAPYEGTQFSLCLMQSAGLCWINQTALHFLPETV